MNSKAKFTLTVTAMVMLTLIAVVSIIAVFAATQQTFSTSITVVYKSTNVEGSTSAQWQLASYNHYWGFSGDWNDMVSSSNQKELDLSSKETLSLSPQESIELSDEHPAIAFKYAFTNTAEHPYTLNFKYQPNTNTKNTNAFYEISSYDMTDIPLSNLNSKFTNMIDTVVPGGASEYICIVLIIDDLGIDSIFDGTFNIELNGQSSDFNEDYIYLFDGTNTILLGVANPEIANATTLDTTNLTYKDAPVNMVRRDAFRYNANLQNVILNGINEIGIAAFCGCSRITNLTFGNNLAIIGYGAFSGCENLESISIPSSVTSIGNNAFNSCVKLTEVTIDSETVCGNLVSWEGDYSTKTYLIDYATTIKAKYEITGLTGFTNNGQQGAYWVYTKNA